MPKRSVTDAEIGLIKAMLSRGMKNRDIQFYFNRPDRPVNSGRITGVRKNSYGGNVSEASQSELDNFLEAFESGQVEVSSGSPLNSGADELRNEALKRFERSSDEKYYLIAGETIDQECKHYFDLSKISRIIRTIAGFANRAGGFIFFGVKDDTHEAVGLSDEVFNSTDIAKITQHIKKHLMPTPIVTKFVVPIAGRIVGILHVEKHDFPPVVVCRDGDKLEEGAILYRYPGETAKIKYGDLMALLNERDRQSQGRLVRKATQISEIGAEDAVIVDLSGRSMSAGGAELSIDESLIDQINFIRQGQFDEKEGSPTLRLIGDIRSVSSEGEVTERFVGRAITADDVLTLFLNQEDVSSPLEYISVSAFVQRQWLPLFYFADRSKGGVPSAINALEKVSAVYKPSKQAAIERLKQEKSAWLRPTGEAKKWLEKLTTGADFKIDQIDDISAFARGIQALPDDYELDLKLYDALAHFFEKSQDNSALKGHIFRASSRLDEITHRKNTKTA